MKKIKVAVLCGGPSSEWEVSMKSGAQAAKNLPRQKYDAHLVQVTSDGRWLLLKGNKKTPLNVLGTDGKIGKSNLRKFNLAFIALHGKFGEDGRVQSILETIGVPYTGSGVLASALGMNKLKAAEVVSAAGVPSPETIVFPFRPTLKDARRAGRKLGYPLVTKPNESGSSVGVSIVRKDKELGAALKKSLAEDKTVLFQKYIKGRELTCGVLGNTGGKLVPLPPVEIISHTEFFDYDAKYNSKITEELCPAPIPAAITRKVQELAMRAHEALGADGLTRSDFMFSHGKLYFLEINTSPGMTETSLCPEEARAYGWSMGEFLDRICQLALNK